MCHYSARLPIVDLRLMIEKPEQAGRLSIINHESTIINL